MDDIKGPQYKTRQAQGDHGVDLDRVAPKVEPKEATPEQQAEMQIKALFQAATDKKVLAQKREINRLTEQIKALKQDILDMESGDPYAKHKRELSQLYATIAVQRKAIDDRQEWVSKLVKVLKESEGMI